MAKNTQEQQGRKVTASDVAQRAGVSKWTVSRAFTEGASISPKALERVRQAAEELGYRPNLLARSLTTRRTNIVGLVVDELGNPNLATILDEITRQLQHRGYMAMLLNITSEQSYRAAMSLADQFQVDGLIFLGTILSDELLQLARNISDIPLIVLYRNSDNPDIHVVSTDGYRAGQEIAALMAAQGYERIGYMAGPPAETNHLRRLDGFREGLAERGKTLDLILGAEHYQREQGYQSLLRYLDTTPREARIDALFCENDILAIGALEALKVRGEEGRMAIVGFDDIDQAASPCYELTTYRQPLQTLVSEAIRRLTADEPPSRYLAPGALVLRHSHLRG